MLSLVKATFLHMTCFWSPRLRVEVRFCDGSGQQLGRVALERDDGPNLNSEPPPPARDPAHLTSLDDKKNSSSLHRWREIKQNYSDMLTGLISCLQFHSRRRPNASHSSLISFCEPSPDIVGQDRRTFVSLIGQFPMK